MPEINCKKNHLFAILSICVMLFQPMLASAKCGGVDYSWGADALSNAHDFTVTMMLYVVYLVYAIAAIVAINQVFSKELFQSQAHEDARNAPILWNLGDLCPERSR